MKYKIYIVFFIFLSQFLLGIGLKEYNIKVLNEDSLSIKDALIRINKKNYRTNKNGLLKIKNIAENLSVEVEKAGYFIQKKILKSTEDINFFVFILKEKTLNIKVKIVDSFSGSPISTNINLFSSFDSKLISSDANGLLKLSLLKKTKYNFKIEEENYEKFEFNLNTSKLLSSSLVFKLKRKKKKLQFNVNRNIGKMKIKIFENDVNYKDIDFSSKNFEEILYYGKYKIELSSPRYQNFYKEIEINKNTKELSFNLDPAFRTFSFYPEISDKSEISFINAEDIPILEENFSYNTRINFYQYDKIVKSAYISNSKIDVELDFANYDIEFINDFSKSFIKRELSFDTNSSLFLKIAFKDFLTEVTGTVKEDKSLLGGVEVIFADKENKYLAATGIDGSFSIKIPPKKYKLNVSKYGYTLLDKRELFDLSIPNHFYKLNLEVKEVPSHISGFVKDLRGIAIRGVKLTVKSGLKETVTYTDEKGNYSIKSKSGLLFIKAEKSGFKSMGVIRKIITFSTLQDINFRLEEYFANIEGLLTDGINPIKNATIKLYDSKNEIVASSKSLRNGKFKIDNLSIYKKYFLHIESEDYFYYKGKSFTLKKEGLKNHNITLKKNTVRLILEVYNSENRPLANISLFVNKKQFISDINGLVEAEVKVRNQDDFINIEVPEYKILKKVKPRIDDKLLKESIMIR